ncbi:HNH endonuclease signature motif containing protein [Streptomyces sp. NPDC007088]|uniref:HNH endonuclease signature motif containing protein n=1 Tax=Streptomyces sp. NPDC007088 TaxID=3364773 RepID=UPI00369EFC59
MGPPALSVVDASLPVHLVGAKSTKSPGSGAELKTASICQAEGADWSCDRYCYGRQPLCLGHYRQDRKGKALVPIRVPGETPKCQAAGEGWECSRDVTAKGFCDVHYRQEKQGKPLREITRPREKGTCKAALEGWKCEQPEKSLGFCSAHYRQQNLGQPLKQLRIRQSNTGTCKALGEEWSCDKPSRSMGLCSGHYAQGRKGSQLSSLIAQATGLSDRERVEWYRDHRSTISENGCWEVTSTGPNGYRQVHTSRGKMKLLHVLSYESFHGTTSGFPVHHKCAKPACFNPEHLQLVSQRENVAEMLERNAYIRRIEELESRVHYLETLLGERDNSG